MPDQITKEEITYFATTDFRNRMTPFGIKRNDRRAHMYILGKTGTGKSTLFETLIWQDISSGHGLALLDPHGDLVDKVLSGVPAGRSADLIYFDAADTERPLGFNPLECVAPEYRPLAASGLLSVFQHIWADSWGPRLEHILRNALLALLERPSATLADIPTMGSS
jgi:DNA helicase HerA-like ATPase